MTLTSSCIYAFSAELFRQAAYGLGQHHAQKRFDSSLPPDLLPGLALDLVHTRSAEAPTAVQEVCATFVSLARLLNSYDRQHSSMFAQASL